MGSLGGSEAAVVRKNAMWVFPKMMMMGAANPSERWGHSACYSNGSLYIFGGCRGGVHFSDVLVYNLPTATWTVLRTSGPGPGPRDSHSAALVGRHRMIVFGGTNGSKKVNDLHVLDLLSGEWARPECRGSPPPARESHTATLVGDDKLVVFGGSGEGEGNYLNDLHVLDLNNMEWSSPEPARGGGRPPAPRDSHSAVAVGSKLFVFGGDSGDRYQGDVSVLDVNSLVWSRLDDRGPFFPGARAGHAAVSIGTKMYVLGGVGDKHYYNDIWALDVITSSWARLDVSPQNSQGRFSHTATVTNLGIVVFGGCGEDERPLNELLVLQIDSVTGQVLGNTNIEDNMRTKSVAENEDAGSLEVEEIECIPKKSPRISSDMSHPKRKRTTSNSKFPERRVEREEHSHSPPSQQSSPSDHDPIPLKKGPYPSSRVHPMLRHKISVPSCYELSNAQLIKQANPTHNISRTCPDISSSSSEHKNVIIRGDTAEESLSTEAAGKCLNLIGADVRGHVDGAFDSGYLMTATVNGKVFRGVLFAPAGVDGHVMKGSVRDQHAVSSGPIIHSNHVANPKHFMAPSEQITQSRRSSPKNWGPRAFGKGSRPNNSDLQGVVLTLASPGSGLGHRP